MIRTFTNLAWPDDPYRASQQLYRRPSPMLAAFAAVLPGNQAAAVPSATAIAYLPLHRTRSIEVTEQTLAYGFRAAAITDGRSIEELVAAADLDLLQARRHAAILAGHDLASKLHALREAAPGHSARGITAVESCWASRGTRRRGMAEMIDTAADLGGSPSPRGLDTWVDAPHPALAPSPAPVGQEDAREGELAAAAAAVRALTIALACASHTGRYRWHGSINVAAIMAGTVWDLFPQITWLAGGHGEQ